ncbi:MAG: glycosyltransferase family 39 protein [Thermoanaerobaculia bacterium]
MPPLDSASATRWRDVFCLALFFGLLYFFQLGDAHLANPDEGRYAEIPREMIANGDYVLPRLNGVFYFEKPPLVYWLVAGFERLLGPNELAVRATPALFALTGVLLIYGTARRLYGRLSGLCAAGVLGTSLLYFGLARLLLLDMVVSVLMSATLFCFILGVREPPGGRRRALFCGLYVSAALATLTKGLIGFLVPGAVMLLWLLLFDQWRRLRPFYLPTGALLFLGVAAPWHLLAAQRNADWARFYFVHEHWERFTTTSHGRFEPWWFFIPIVLGGLFPWTGFLFQSLREALAGGWARRKENSEAWFFALWAAFVFLFFSKSQSKLIPYILPVFPPLALVSGKWLARVIDEDARARLRAGVWVFSVLAATFGLASAYVVLRPETLRHIILTESLRADGLCLALALVTGATVAPWIRRRRSALATVASVAASLVVALLVLAHAQDGLARSGTRNLAATFNAKAQPGDRVFHYSEYFHDFSFYTRREVGLVGRTGELELAIDPAARASGRFIDEAEFRRLWTGPERVWLVTREGRAKRLFSDSSLRYDLVDEDRSLSLYRNRP